MDFGIKGKIVFVCVLSKGFGCVCVFFLVCEGVYVILLVCGVEVLEVMVQVICMEIVVIGVNIIMVVCDIIILEGCVLVLVVCFVLDILVINVGGFKLGDFCEWMWDDWIVVVDVNMLMFIELIKVIVDGMIVCGFGCIVNIMLSVVWVLIDILGFFNGVCLGLMGFVVGLVCKMVVYNVIINNFLLGLFEMDCLCFIVMGVVKESGCMVDEVLVDWCKFNLVGCFGDLVEFGDVCVYLCSVQVGFIMGQNLLMDGGVYLGMF